MESQLSRFLTREQIMKDNGISRSTFFRFQKQGILERVGPTSPIYSEKSVERLKTYLDVKSQIGS